MLELMVDILTGDYYHLEHSKGPPRILENNTTAAIGGWPFNNKGLVTTMLDSRRPKKIELSTSGMASYPKNHRHVYPLGLSQPISPTTYKTSSPTNGNLCQQIVVLYDIQGGSRFECPHVMDI
jgi:hypothetical protein